MTVHSRPFDHATEACAKSSVDTRRSRKGKQHVEDVPSDAPSPKHRKGDPNKGKGVADNGNKEPQSPVFIGVDAFSHLSPDTIDKSTHRLSVSGNSTVFNSKPEEVSFKMYKVFLLPQYQIALASLHHARLEMLGAHLHHQRYNRDDVQAWIRPIEEANENLESDLKDARAKHVGAKEQIKELSVEKAQAQQKASDAQQSCEALKAEVRSLKAEVELLKDQENKSLDSGVT
ncbi:hypothetical protein Salat_1194500 [Sesamum alatum]|uniref:Uncharacterized protein n=1 Tax=Sesamum alatum TaxID=300844 RepID=A0AAE2CNR0_9LAMI|nr:hypothetical protein Salat_1194500 [Sesamum alatum]